MIYNLLGAEKIIQADLVLTGFECAAQSDQSQTKCIKSLLVGIS